MATSVGPITIPRINYSFIVGGGFLTTIQAAVDYAVSIGIGNVLIPQGYAGTDDPTNVINGSNLVFIIDARNGQRDTYAWVNGAYVLQPLTAQSAVFDSVEANTATFDSCIVHESPVRTFANTPGGGDIAMVWPEIGIPVSEGDHWQDPSIDPATLATWPEAGVPVSTGTSWVTTSIPPSSIAMLNATQTFNGNQTINGTTQLNGNLGVGTSATVVDDGNELTLGQNALMIGRRIGSPFGNNFEMRVDNSIPASFIDSWGDLNINSSRPGHSMNMNGSTNIAGNLYVNGTATTTGNFSAPSANVSGTTTTGSLSAGSANISGTATATTFSSSGDAIIGGTVAITNHLDVGGIYNINQFSDQGPILRMGDGAYGFSVANQTLHVWVANGAMMVHGNIYATGVISPAGASILPEQTPSMLPAGLRIPHPSKKNKELVHSSLEGPEAAVFYRGEGETKNFNATIQLPDYFDSLVANDGRTVQLTAMVDKEEDEAFGFLASSPVKDGKFRVYSSEETQKFYWEVKAIRADIPPLEVERDIPPQDKKDAKVKSR